jgi:hypothetical protein
MTRGWGYEINYDEALAEDDRRIAEYDRALEFGWYAGRSEYGYCRDLKLVDLVLSNPDLPGVTLTTQERGNLIDFFMLEHIDLPEGYEREAGWYERAETTIDRIESLFANFLPMDETEAKKERTQWVRSRGRHRRNKAKYGGSQ